MERWNLQSILVNTLCLVCCKTQPIMQLILVCCFQNMIKPAMISHKFYVFVLHQTTHENNSLVFFFNVKKIINGKERCENMILIKL